MVTTGGRRAASSSLTTLGPRKPLDSWHTAANLLENIVTHGSGWIGPIRSNRLVTYAGEERLVDELYEAVEL